MKALKFLIPLICAICLSGCFEMNEEIEVSANGGGNLAVKMDMSQMVDMIQAFMPAEELEKADLNQAKDTTIQMKDLVDTASSLSADKKAVLRDGNMRLQMSLKEKIFKLDMKYPFSNGENLQKLYATMGEASNGMGNILKGLNQNSSIPSGAEPEFKQLSSYFDLVAKKGSLVRTLNKEKYALLSTDSTMQQMKQMGSMGGGLDAVKMNTVIKLPAAAKKITGTKAELSADKKTVTLKNSLLDVFENPEVFEFTIEY